MGSTCHSGPSLVARQPGSLLGKTAQPCLHHPLGKRSSPKVSTEPNRFTHRSSPSAHWRVSGQAKDELSTARGRPSSKRCQHEWAPELLIAYGLRTPHIEQSESVTSTSGQDNRPLAPRHPVDIQCQLRRPSWGHRAGTVGVPQQALWVSQGCEFSRACGLQLPSKLIRPGTCHAAKVGP